MAKIGNDIPLSVELLDLNGASGVISGFLSLSQEDILEGEAVGNAGWRRSNWFGEFLLGQDSWIFHYQLGWLFVAPDTSDGHWFWDPFHQGWWWTNEQSYPYYLLHLETFPIWHYLDSQNGALRYYDFESNVWSSRP